MSNSTQASAQSNMNIARFFGKCNTVNTPGEPTTVDLTSLAAVQPGHTPGVSKVLFGSSATSISAKKDLAQPTKMPDAWQDRPLPHTAECIPPPTLLIKPALQDGIDLTDQDKIEQHVADENDEVSRLEGSPARSEKMSDCGKDEGGSLSSTPLCSLSSLIHPSPSSIFSDTPAPATLPEAAASFCEEITNKNEESEEMGKDREQTPVVDEERAPRMPLPPLSEVIPHKSDIGRHVDVFWPQENQWYRGIIDKFRDADDKICALPSYQDQGQAEIATTTVATTADSISAIDSDTVLDAVTDAPTTIAPTCANHATSEKSESEQKPLLENATGDVSEKQETFSCAAFHISYDDDDQEWIDGDDLRALIFADKDTPQEVIAMRRAAVEVALASLVKKKKPRAARKPTAKAVDGEWTAKRKGRGRGKAAASAASVAPAKPLPPDVVRRVSANEAKRSAVMIALAATRDIVLSRHRLHYDHIVASVMQGKNELSPAKREDERTEGEEEEKQVQGAHLAPESLDEVSVQRLISLLVQDSTCSLTTLVHSISTSLHLLLCPASSPVSWHDKYCNAASLTEYIKSSATRTSYGFRSSSEVKLTSPFEDESPLALWRWESMSLPVMEEKDVIATSLSAHATGVDEGSEKIIPAEQEREPEVTGDEKERVQLKLKQCKLQVYRTAEALKTIKLEYQRAGKVVKAVHRVLAELIKAAENSTISASAKAKAVMVGASTLDPSSEVKIASEESKVAKCQTEVQKALERKQQAEKKWLLAQEEIESKRADITRRKLMQAKKTELQHAQQTLKLSKAAASEEAKHAKAAMSSLLGDSKRKAKGEDEDTGSKKKTKILSEKEVKAQALLAKQKSMMSSFFKSGSSIKSTVSAVTSPAMATGTSSTASSCINECEQSSASPGPSLTSSSSTDSLNQNQETETPLIPSQDNCTIDLTTGIDNSTTITSPVRGSSGKSPKILPTRKPQQLTAAASLIQAARQARPLDEDQFEESIRSSALPSSFPSLSPADGAFSMNDISAFYRNRYSNTGVGESGERKRKKLRKPVKLSITVTVEQKASVFVPGEGFRGPSAFEMAMGGGSEGGGEYSEQKTVFVDSRKKLLSFSEDLRPPYYGTWSKRSREVSGRRPFGKDIGNGLDYDVDSEAEWEEEEEGEDIIMSEDEDEEGGNDIVYDEFFCPDDEVVYADPRGGDSPSKIEGGGKTEGVDSVSAIFKAMKAQSGEGEREVHGCISGVRFVQSEDVLRDSSDGSEDPTIAQLSRYSAVVDPCSYWSPLPPEVDVGTISPEGRVSGGSSGHAPSLPSFFLSTPSMTAAINAQSSMRNDSVAGTAKKDKVDTRLFQDTLLPCLALYLHGKRGGVDKMVEGFVSLWKKDDPKSASNDAILPVNAPYLPPYSVRVPPSKAQIKVKIKEIASSGTGKGSLWVVRPEVIAKCPLPVADQLVQVAFPTLEKGPGAVSGSCGGTAATGGKNKVLSFPVVSATVALARMNNVTVSSVTSVNTKVSPLSTAALSTSLGSTVSTPKACVGAGDAACVVGRTISSSPNRLSDSSCPVTPGGCKDNDRAAGTVGGSAQHSLLHFFKKPAVTPSSKSASEKIAGGIVDLSAVTEEVEVFDEEMKGVTWWGETKEDDTCKGSGSSFPVRKRQHEEENSMQAKKKSKVQI